MQPSRLSMVTELCAIGSLKHVLAEFALPWDMTIRVCLDTSVGLLFLHETGLLHQDIKPGNVLVAALSADAPVVAKLTDFGSTGRVVTETAGRFALAGTPVYLAPEMDGRHAPSEAADVYSWAITAYEVVTQSDPFPDIDLAWSIASHVRSGNRPIFPEDVLEQAPPALVAVIRKAWATDPDERPPLGTIIPEIVKSFKELELDDLYDVWLAETSVTTERLELDLARLGTDAAYREQGLPRSSGGDSTGTGSLGLSAGSPHASMTKPTTGRVLRRGVTGLFGPDDLKTPRPGEEGGATAPKAAVESPLSTSQSLAPPRSPRSPAGHRRRTPPRRQQKRRSTHSRSGSRSRSPSRQSSHNGSQEIQMAMLIESGALSGSGRSPAAPGSPVRAGSGRLSGPVRRLRSRATSFEMEMSGGGGLVTPFSGLPTMMSEDDSASTTLKRQSKGPGPAMPQDPGPGTLPRSLSTLNRRIARAAKVQTDDREEDDDFAPEGLPRSTPSTFQVSERGMTGPPTLRRHAQVIDPEQAELLVRVAGSTVCLVRATQDHQGKSSAELTFFVGEAFSASPTRKEGTWRGIHKGKTGLFPFHKVELVVDAAVENAKDRAKSRRAKSKK
jgi:serine/threonine protein kinase